MSPTESSLAAEKDEHNRQLTAVSFWLAILPTAKGTKDAKGKTDERDKKGI
jgi:hypothetical protein